MRFPLLILAAAGLLVAALPSAEAAERHVSLVARDNGLEFWFELAGAPSADNTSATLVANPGDTVLIHLVNQGTAPHNFKLDAPAAVDSPIVRPGDPLVVASFTIPPDAAPGNYTYYCRPHGEGLMSGTLQVVASSPPPGHGSEDHSGHVSPTAGDTTGVGEAGAGGPIPAKNTPAPAVLALLAALGLALVVGRRR